MQIYSCKNIPNSSQEKMQSIIEAISVSYSPNRFDHPVLTFFMAKIGLSCVLDDTLLFLTQGWRSSNCTWSIKWAQSLWKFNKSSFHFEILEFSLGCKVCKCVLCKQVTNFMQKLSVIRFFLPLKQQGPLCKFSLCQILLYFYAKRPIKKLKTLWNKPTTISR